ncbi:MAG: hypothetical protein WCA46_20720 [Actinocatenispora sp.]
MRRRGGVLMAAGALAMSGLALSGCARLEHPTVAPAPSVSEPAGSQEFEAAPSPSPSPKPAKAAGGTCRMLDYDSAEKATGTRFEVAAASTSSGAQTCALQVLYSEHPDLVVSVVSTEADAKAFAKAAPDEAKKVDGIGKAAYSRVVDPDPDAGTGPAVEVAWLSGKGDIVTVRYTNSADVDLDTARGSVDRIVSYAKGLEAAR